MTPSAVLETVLYVPDIDAAEAFYRDVLGLPLISRLNNRHLFFKIGKQMLLLFNPKVTVIAPDPEHHLPIPPHGAIGEGHVCFSATSDEIAGWRLHLESKGVLIESDFEWPNGGRSIYFRDPAGNCLEFAEPRIWGLK